MHGSTLKKSNRIQGLALVAALALCLSLAHASWHWHDAGCGETICAICVSSGADGAAGTEIALATRHLGCASPEELRNSFLPGPRVFDAHPPRAPPVS